MQNEDVESCCWAEELCFSRQASLHLACIFLTFSSGRLQDWDDCSVLGSVHAYVWYRGLLWSDMCCINTYSCKENWDSASLFGYSSIWRLTRSTSFLYISDKHADHNISVASWQVSEQQQWKSQKSKSVKFEGAQKASLKHVAQCVFHSHQSVLFGLTSNS